MSYIELKNDKYESLEDLKRLLHYILRLDKTAEDSQRANTITNTLAGCQPAMIPNEYLCDPSSVYNLMLFEVRRRHILHIYATNREQYGKRQLFVSEL